jgi:hypothetical protein
MFGRWGRRRKWRRREEERKKKHAGEYGQMKAYLAKSGMPSSMREMQLRQWFQSKGLNYYSDKNILEGELSRVAQRAKVISSADTMLKALADAEARMKKFPAATYQNAYKKVFGSANMYQLNQVRQQINQGKQQARHQGYFPSHINRQYQQFMKRFNQVLSQLESVKAKAAAAAKAASEKKTATAKAAAAKAKTSKSAADKADALKKTSDAKKAAVKASQKASAAGDTKEAAKQMSIAQKIAALEAKIRGYETKAAERRGYEKARKEFRQRRRRWGRRRRRDPSPKKAPAKAPTKAKAPAKAAAPVKKAAPKPVTCTGGKKLVGGKCVAPRKPRMRCPKSRRPNWPSNWYDPAAEQRYLNKYADINAAVGSGAIRSGLYHYACTGSREGRTWSGLEGFNRPGYLAGIFSNWDQEYDV